MTTAAGFSECHPCSRLTLLPISPVAHFDVLNPALRGRNGYTVFAHAFKMKLDGLADLGLHLFEGSAGGDAAGKVWDIGGIVVLGLLDDDRIPHNHLTS